MTKKFVYLARLATLTFGRVNPPRTAVTTAQGFVIVAAKAADIFLPTALESVDNSGNLFNEEDGSEFISMAKTESHFSAAAPFDKFYEAIGLYPLEKIEENNPGISVLRCRVLNDAISLGFVRQIRFDINYVSGPVDVRFGKKSKNHQLIVSPDLSLLTLRSNLRPIVFQFGSKTEPSKYQIKDSNSIVFVNRRKYV